MTQCPNCGAGLRPESVRCAKCGSVLRDEPPRAAPPPTPSAPQTAPAAPPTPVGERRSAALALLLSFFIPGLGQLYNGQFVKGLLFFLAWIALWCKIDVRLGPHVLLGFLVHVVAAFEAHRTAAAHNRRIGS